MESYGRFPLKFVSGPLLKSSAKISTCSLEGIEMVCLCPSAHLNNCSDQVIDMAQVQQIYARLFTHINVAEFVREQNQRIFAKLNAIQDAALMRSSSQVPIQKAALQFLHTEDMSNVP